jgi:hypothetical protein
VEHLHILLRNLIPFLQQQSLQFTILVIEQSDLNAFNRGALLNVGYVKAKEMADFDCYILHDVDLIPEDLSNLYACTSMVRSLVTGRSHKAYA